MNKIIFSVLLISSSSLALADGEEQSRPCTELHTEQAAITACQQERGRASDSRSGNGNGNGNGNRSNEVASQCNQAYSSASSSIRTVQTAAPGATNVSYFRSAEAPAVPVVIPPPGAAPVAGVTPDPNLALPAISIDRNASLKTCKGYEAISSRLGTSIGVTESRRAMDGSITCVRKAGITADWDSCSSALSMYNNIKMAESAMQIFQGVQTNSVQNRAQNEFAQRQATGDGQNAAYDAQTTTMNSAKQLNEQQAMAYAAAVAALYSKIQSWIKESPEAFIQKGCPGAAAAAPARTPPVPATASATELFASVEATPRPAPASADCAAAARRGYQEYQGYVFANKDAKGQFTAAAMLFAGKAIAAGIKANQLGDIAKKIQEAKATTEDPYNPATFDLCQVNSADPKCAQVGTRTPGTGLQDGGFSFGEGFGNNAFTPIGSAEDMENVAPGALPGDQVVGDTTNPFVDDAKKASGILDPAGAASTQAAAAGGGGGSGGGGAGGGGSASLGNDTPGADDSKKENDIKANKADGKYGSFAGGAFQAIKPMKDENPFANLFDGKGGGKLEEDRSIASGDIDGRDSGIFSKISKRYGQVQADKRIEAKNLEE